MVTLRPYQEQAISTVMEAMHGDRYILLQGATGMGKTILFSELIKRILKEYRGMRIVVLAHRRELIQQAAEKLKKVWPGAPIGLACAGVGGNMNLFSPVVIGSIQTLANRLGTIPPFDMAIIDEVHRIPPKKKGAKSQYHLFLDTMESYYPEIRVLGVTATPFRLGHGYIFGDRCKPGHQNLFQDLHFRIGIRELQEEGYLCPIRAKEAENIELELAGVRTSGGDYNLGDLSKLMSREIHVGSAVRAYREYGEGREHVVVFCVTIEHAQKVQEAFKEEGYATGCVHSEMSNAERDETLAGFKDGSIRILTNVGVLTEGWDAPAVDCILLCRPTKSPALYVQMIGRGTRPHPGKEDLLVLDLSGNIHTHGDPDNPRVVVPGAAKGPPPPSMKTCPNCKTVVPATTYECPDCGYEWERPAVVERNEEVKMIDVSLVPDPKRLTLEDVGAFDFVSARGNRMLKLELTARNGGRIPQTLLHFLDVEGNASSYGQRRARLFWRQYSTRHDDPVPETIDEALSRFDELMFPDEIRVVEDGKYLRVAGW